MDRTVGLRYKGGARECHCLRGDPMAHQEALAYTVVSVDVEDSSSHTNSWQLRMRSDLRTMARDALADLALPPDAIDRQDLGDGIRLIAAPTVSAIVLLAGF